MKHLLKTIFLFLITINAVTAQNNSKFDKIIKKDYDIIEVNITKISDKEVEFTYPNETLTIHLELSKVAKIIFKSGRTQEFKMEEKAEVTTGTEVAKPVKVEKVTVKQNTIAVLPVPFLNSETLASSSEMSKMAQNDIYSQLIDRSSNIFPLTVQDLRTTNSLLKKAGIDYSNIDETPIENLQEILGVDHIVAAKVNYIMNLQNSTATYGNAKVTDKGKSTKIDDFSYTDSEENKRFQYTVYFDMYKNNSKIYTKTRQPMMESKDSWIDSVRYLLKRCPVYVK